MSVTDQDSVARLLGEKELSRKSFLRAGGSLVVGLSIAGAAANAAAAANNPSAILPLHTGATPGPPVATQVDSWLQVNPDNTVTLYSGWVELGQGTPTAVKMIAAEELGMSVDQITTAQVDTNVSLSAFTVGSSSTSTAMGATSLRGAAAAARQLLLNMASTQLGVPVGNLSVSNGVVSGGGKTVKYSDLMAGKLFNSTIAAANATLTPVANYKVIGTRVPRIDIPAIVTGQLTYVQNVRVPGMLHGRVVRPSQAALTQGAKLLSIDAGSIAHIPGAQVVRKNNFVGVVAPKEWDAIEASVQLKVKWDSTPMLPGSGNLEQALRDPAKLQSSALAVNTGDVGAGLAASAKVVSGSYYTAYQMHGSLGPNCAVADVTPSGTLIFCASQGPYFTTRGPIATALGIPANSVRVEVFPFSGTYGHSTYDDVAISAALMSQAVGKPVRVQFMRWDEHGWDNLGPAQATDIRAGIDASGNLVAYDYTAYNHGWTQSVESAAELSGVPLPPVPGGQVETTANGSFYKLPNRRVTGKVVNGYAGFLKGTYLRAPGVPQAVFASEQTIDQLAHIAGLDPIAFRIQNIDATQTAGVGRWVAVLDAVSKAANWKPKVSASNLGSGNVVTGRGVALGGFAGSFPAIIADVTVNKKSGQITVDHLYAAQDAGTTVNPASVENQMVGCLIHGTSRALMEQVTFSKVRMTSLDWVTYPVLRFKQSPKVTTVVVQRLDLAAAGSGEPTTAAVPAAIANAFFDATGVRLYRMPMTPGQVRGALHA
jgi:CO/xanthine dehydrogenase Mo-binding subunit